ncbi:F-box and leucine-rich repeat protein 13-like isoform X1 [Bolinopsis microptera]|uniref:F-box and leucine-rich repeat protein 13-like isoform X1 n=1 Tax=Bolinopsis microptera TaxID=2820187 RepID=UPI00307B0A98
MATFNDIQPQLKAYLLKHRLPDLFECIFTALAASKPTDPNKFILDKLKEYQEGKHFDLSWDSFVSRKDLPPKRVFKRTFIENFFTLEDLAELETYLSTEDYNNLRYYFYFQPSEEQKRLAAQAYNDSLIKKHFKAWLGFYNRKKEKCRKAEEEWQRSVQFHKHKLTVRTFQEWYAWKCERYRSQQEAAPILADKMRRICLQNAIYTTFRAWQQVTKHASDTNKWFKKYEILNSDDEDEVKDKAVGQDFISKLPHKASNRIFSFLDVLDRLTCSLVCRSWKIMVQDRSLWTQIDLQRIKDRTTDRLVANLAHKFRSFLCNLNLRDCVRVTSSSLRYIGECRNLQELSLSGIKQINADVVNDIGLGCKNLLYLNIAKCYFDDGVLRVLARHYVNIQYLSLAGCTGFSTAGVYYFMVGQGLHKLSHLDISGCSQITHEGMRYIARGCPLLHSLVLNKLARMKDESLYFFTKYCPNLRALHLRHASSLTDTAFMHIAENLPRLKTLCVEGNHNITGASIKMVGRGCPDLVHLFIIDCIQMCDTGLKGFSGTRGLRVVNLGDCIRISDHGVRNIVDGPSGPHIRELNLTNCLRVGDTTLFRIAQRCQNLAYVSFCYSEFVTDAGVELLGNMQALRSLDLSGCAVGDAGLASLGNNPNFRNISLSECNQITDVGIQKMCSRLLLSKRWTSLTV